MLKLAGFINEALNSGGGSSEDKVLTLDLKTSNNQILDQFLELLFKL
jgi:hypothetical protein